MAWLTNLRRPVSDALADRALWWGSVLFVLSALGAAALLWGLSDRWWPATVLLFGPRWVLLLPVVPLLAAAAVRDRALVVPLLVGALVIVGPVIGLQTGWRALLVSGDETRDIRVVTFNAMGGETLTAGPTRLMLEWDADVAAFQECEGPLRRAIRGLTEWHTSSTESLCLISRYDILEVLTMEREAFEQAGGSGLVVSYRLKVQDREIWLTNAHLQTPRAGLEMIRRGVLSRGALRLASTSRLREVELRRARSWVDDLSGPRVVVGDFNTPPESLLYRAAWADWTNAFTRVGHGFGGTRLNGWIRARIDHVLTDGDWTVVSARVGQDRGSDHLAVIADLRLR